MRSALRWLVVVLVLAHGLIHLFGAAKGFGWAEGTQLGQPISPALGVAWTAAAALVLVTGVLLAARTKWWWVVGAVAVVVSQAVIFTSWSEAKAGTVANVVLFVAVAYGYAAQGPISFRAEYRRRVATALAAVQGPAGDVAAEADLTHLPNPVAAYVRRSGAVGLPRVVSFRARIQGRIRAGKDAAWMNFTGQQVNTFGAEPSRLFLMDVTMFGLPVDVVHAYVGPSATMRVRVCSLVPMVNASGPEMDQGETVTMFNDLCLLAPAALIDARVAWEPVDSKRVRGTFTNGAHSVRAELVFDDDGDLVDFVSDDRLRSSPDGRAFTPQRWSTPVRDYRTFDSRRVPTHGEARWHAPEPEGEFTYIELTVDEIVHNPSNAG